MLYILERFGLPVMMVLALGLYVKAQNAWIQNELQTELKFLQETVGVLVGAMMEEGESEDFFGNAEDGNPSFRLNMGM